MAIQGLVKWFDPKKGYGFLVGPDGQDVFVHYSQILGEGFRTLVDGEPVDYDLVHGTKGFQAQNVMAAAGDAADRARRPPLMAGGPVDDEFEAQRQHARALAAEEEEEEEEVGGEDETEEEDGGRTPA